MKTKIVKPKLLLLLVAIALLFACGSCPAQVFSAPDETAYHVYAGTGISALSGTVLYGLTKRPGLSILGSFAVSGLVMGGKELIYDRALGHGQASWGDFWAGSWGSLIGTMCVGIGISMHRTKEINAEYFQNLR